MISVVIPIYNEEESILSLYQGLVRVFDDLREPWELIVVDDGSSDSTFALLRSISHRDPRVKVVRLRRNFGQTCALAAGFHYARGAVIVTMDGDLQNDPSDIPRLLSKLDEGYDIVSGWRRARKDGFFAKRMRSRPRLESSLPGGAAETELRDALALPSRHGDPRRAWAWGGYSARRCTIPKAKPRVCRPTEQTRRVTQR